jgi:hypothetical protein
MTETEYFAATDLAKARIIAAILHDMHTPVERWSEVSVRVAEWIAELERAAKINEEEKP